ncbi:ATP-binding protein [Gracilimonas halophila]|uniref:ATP-binding protein n=1 Tax=Gracilimonas halophila TaxID=1834464 RepID=A0ABW5JNJ8_9BACT
MIPRILTKDLRHSLDHFPVTAILGPRQCGKSTLAKHMISELDREAVYLDLERPSDLQKLEDAEWFLSRQKGKLVCIDEIQREPELFPVLRSIVDAHEHNGQFLILGSASRDLIKQSSESLAGRIIYKKLTPFLWDEIHTETTLEEYMVKGGFPRSVMVGEKVSMEWRESFITTFLERDLLQFAGFSPVSMRRLWQMLAHSNGQTANYSALGSSLGISHTSVKKYIDLLEGTFMVRQLRPYKGNTKKRLVKSPKVYITDSGLTTALLKLRSFEEAAGHPAFGSLWESMVIENIAGHYPKLELSFYRTNHGNEIDLVISDGTSMIAIECKSTLSPNLSRGNYTAIEDIDPVKTLVVIPAEKGYPYKENIDVVTLSELIKIIPELLKI